MQNRWVVDLIVSETRVGARKEKSSVLLNRFYWKFYADRQTIFVCLYVCKIKEAFIHISVCDFVCVCVFVYTLNNFQTIEMKSQTTLDSSSFNFSQPLALTLCHLTFSNLSTSSKKNPFIASHIVISYNLSVRDFRSTNGDRCNSVQFL